jgi:hypothetical protein
MTTRRRMFVIPLGGVDHYADRFTFADPSGVVWEICPSASGLGFDLRAQSGEHVASISHTANRVQMVTVRDGDVISGGPGFDTEVQS